MGCRRRKYRSKQLLSAHVVNLNTAVDHESIECVSHFAVITQTSYCFYFGLVCGQSPVFGLNRANFDLLRVDADEISDRNEFEDFQISRLYLQVIKSAEAVQTIDADGPVVRAANEVIWVLRTEIYT